jgi:hypothetical protein
MLTMPFRTVAITTAALRTAPVPLPYRAEPVAHPTFANRNLPGPSKQSRSAPSRTLPSISSFDFFGKDDPRNAPLSLCCALSTLKFSKPRLK